MSRYALINPSNAIDRFSSSVDPNVQTKAGWKWLPCDPVAQPAFDPLTEIVTGPTYIIGASSVTEVWAKRNLTAQEISAAKDAAIAALNGTLYAALATSLLALENDNRTIKSKINDLITEQVSTVSKFTAGQIAQITLAQLKAGFKALL